MNKPSLNIALIIGLATFMSFGCGVGCILVLTYTPNSGFVLWTQRPFWDFNAIGDLYKGVTTVGGLVRMNASLLETAWCNDEKDTYNKYAYNMNQGCDCLYQEYATLWDQIYPAIFNNAPKSSDYNKFIHDPLNPSKITSLTATGLQELSANTATVSRVLLDTYAQRSMSICKYRRNSWRSYIYSSKMHPCIIGYFCAFTLFIFSSLYFEMVLTPGELGGSAKYFILVFITLIAILPLIVNANVLFNLVYIVGMVMVSATFFISINDEFLSISDSQISSVSYPNVFIPPHPIRVGVWYVIYATFPVILMYTAMMNFTRDIVALFGVWVMGVVMATVMQRYFWCKCYLHPELLIEAFGNQPVHLRKKTADAFRFVMVWSLGVIAFVMSFLIGCFFYLDWFTQDFMPGNWVGMVSLLMYFTIFVIEIFENDNEGRSKELKYNSGMSLQVVMLNLTVLLLCVSSWADAFLNVPEKFRA